MLRAGALFVAVVMAFVIALLSTFLILLSYHYKLQARESLVVNQLDLNLHSAIRLLLSEYELEDRVPQTLDLYEKGEDSVTLKKQTWGAYEVGTVKAFSGRYTLSKTIQYGYTLEEPYCLAIYMADLNRPLSVCGKNIIKGNCQLPEKGVKGTYIEGKSFEGKDFVQGKIDKSKSSIPALNDKVLSHIESLFKKEQLLSSGYKVVDYEGQDTLIQSFMDSTLVLLLGNTGRLDQQYFEGNIILFSEGQLDLGRDLHLQNVLVVAPTVQIKSSFSGSMQVFATDSVIVEEDCKLNYPSVIGLFKKDHKVQQPFIKIKQGSVVQGVLFTSQAEEVTDMSQTLISIDKDAVLEGQLYAHGFAEIRGEVRGSVYCNRFVLKTKSSVYENHLLDAVIDYTQLSKHYIGTGLINSAQHKGIIKWLE